VKNSVIWTLSFNGQKSNPIIDRLLPAYPQAIRIMRAMLNVIKRFKLTASKQGTLKSLRADWSLNPVQ
tara:strand:- start:1179 stop:1382 length:204 start_codon:yes stop_codon:yes gene_type:complete